MWISDCFIIQKVDYVLRDKSELIHDQNKCLASFFSSYKKMLLKRQYTTVSNTASSVRDLSAVPKSIPESLKFFIGSPYYSKIAT